MEQRQLVSQLNAGVVEIVRAVTGAVVEVEAALVAGVEAETAIEVVEAEIGIEAAAEKRSGYVSEAGVEKQAAVLVHVLSTCCAMGCRS